MNCFLIFSNRRRWWRVKPVSSITSLMAPLISSSPGSTVPEVSYGLDNECQIIPLFDQYYHVVGSIWRGRSCSVGGATVGYCPDLLVVRRFEVRSEVRGESYLSVCRSSALPSSLTLPQSPCSPPSSCQTSPCWLLDSLDWWQWKLSLSLSLCTKFCCCW